MINHNDLRQELGRHNRMSVVAHARKRSGASWPDLNKRAINPAEHYADT